MKNRDVIQLEFSVSHLENLKLYIMIDQEEKIWVDTQGLPEIAVLCAMHDNKPMMMATIRDKEEEEKRRFLEIDWVIDEWGEDEELIEGLRKKKKMVLDNLPDF